MCMKVTFLHCTKPANNTIKAQCTTAEFCVIDEILRVLQRILLLNNSYNTWARVDAQSTIFAGVYFVSA